MCYAQNKKWEKQGRCFTMGNGPKRETPKRIRNSLRDWNIAAVGLRVIYIFLVTLSIVCSVIVAAKVSSLAPIVVEGLAIVAAISVGLLSGLDIGGNANRMRKAWRRLNPAVIRFEEDSNYKEEELFRAYEDAEAMIAEIKESPR
jgi:hypothetical protein